MRVRVVCDTEAQAKQAERYLPQLRRLIWKEAVDSVHNAERFNELIEMRELVTWMAGGVTVRVEEDETPNSD